MIYKKQSRIGFEYLFLSLVKYCFACLNSASCLCYLKGFVYRISQILYISLFYLLVLLLNNISYVK